MTRRKRQSLHTLVRFCDDGVLFICSESNVEFSEEGFLVRWRDGQKYLAEVLKTADKETIYKIHITTPEEIDVCTPQPMKLTQIPAHAKDSYWFVVEAFSNAHDSERILCLCESKDLRLQDRQLRLMWNEGSCLADILYVGVKDALEKKLFAAKTAYYNVDCIHLHLGGTNKATKCGQQLHLTPTVITSMDIAVPKQPTITDSESEETLPSCLLSSPSIDDDKRNETVRTELTNMVPPPSVISNSQAEPQFLSGIAVPITGGTDFMVDTTDDMADKVYNEQDEDRSIASSKENTHDQTDEAKEFNLLTELTTMLPLPFEINNSQSELHLHSSIAEPVSGGIDEILHSSYAMDSKVKVYNGDNTIEENYDSTSSQSGDEEGGLLDMSSDSEDDYEPESKSTDSESSDDEPNRRLAASELGILNLDLNDQPPEELDERAQEGGQDIIVQGKNAGSKKYHCLYCDKSVSKMARHLEDVHSKEPEVARFLAFPVRHPKRKILIDDLRNRGNFRHNSDVIQDGKGAISTKRRPKETIENPEDYLPCSRCAGSFKQTYLAKHQLRFCKGLLEGRKEGRNNNVQSRCAALLPTSSQASSDLKNKVYSRLAVDRVSKVIKTDPVICLIGSKLEEKYGHEERGNRLIRQRLRLLAKFLITLRKIKPQIYSLSDALNTKNYDACVQSIKSIACFDHTTNMYLKPSHSQKLLTELNFTISVLLGDALKDNNTTLKEQLINFRELIQNSYKREVTHHALRSRNLLKRKKPLPPADDIRRMKDFIQSQETAALEEITSQGVTRSNYSMLLNATLAQLVMFNRRRVGDVERLLIQEFTNDNNNECQEEVLSSLSPSEKILLTSLKMVKTVGKRNRIVPILMNKNHVRNIETLIENRPNVGISPANNFIFTNADTKHYVNACAVIRKFATDKEAGLKFPTRMTSTSLRKHIATLSQVLNLSDHELDLLAKHLGHDIRVHRDFYRLPEDTLELTKIGKLLCSFDKGKIDHLKGKNLNEIELADLPSDSGESDTEIFNGEEQSETHGSKKFIPSASAPGKVPRNSDVPLPMQATPGTSANTTANYTSSGLPNQLPSKPRTVNRVPWTPEEKKAILLRFKGHLSMCKVPQKLECVACLEANPEVLKRRTWKNVKDLVRNNFRKKK